MRHLKRIVIKIGSSVILKKSGELNRECLESLVIQIAEIHRDGEVIIVSSGAIGIGKTILRVNEPIDLSEKQALAAVGQARLMQIYESFFSKFGIRVGQVLLTREDLQGRKRYLNARNTLLKLLEHKVIPVINENDTVAVEEIKFGDNDTLSALIASKMDADLLIILSDVGGVYKNYEKRETGVIREVNVKTIKRISIATKSASAFGIGGITTKIEAAKIMMASGIPMVVAHGHQRSVIRELIKEFEREKETGTWFIPEKKISGKKRWIAFSAEVKGAIIVDVGAAKALKESRKSLLPSGVKKVEGDFESGDVAQVVNTSGQEIAKGLVYYSSDEIRKIAGKKTSEIASILGHKDYDEVIHRDNMVIL
ncbi:glutamate 5-kinase [Candidatus Desantisbacteria bacterium CG07_land_8_20_14_0_80_39_15]|uniref:Glutamate 5-kinase n=2 Tax=unclassified Candidatus Desantisiibacteriota TaxID=3106372 RepID=A0A2H9PBA7_9BACT|nr:MAG: glutamate 5-kinase [Candidatus Desantisbacteria bacterium CG07_land_8_20_14_0_80_39_15]PIZ16011.1 MAG: glutamate 5-kinase [Candidatus Desantisbacteria bacterium CG_4_10_14_0_8_um_filter_39_17]